MTTTTTSTPLANAMGHGNRKGVVSSLSVGDIDKHPARTMDRKDVTNWSSIEVKQWVKEQCKKFELKKATAEKFEMNGQALALLTKHDFLRRSPDGGEILYYALQRALHPHKAEPVRVDQNAPNNGLNSPRPLIVELSPDEEESTGAANPSSTKPIVEEPDDPPKIRRSHSDARQPNGEPFFRPQGPPFAFRQDYVPPTVLTMPAGSAAAFFHQHHQQQQRRPGIPEEFMHVQNGQPHPYPNGFVHPHGYQHFHPMMATQGILIEALDDVDPTSFTDGVNGVNVDPNDTVYMVTMNGQRFLTNEAGVRQLVTDVHQHQAYQENLQHQQRLHQQQQYYQQQQQFYQQQQQQYQQQQQQQQQQQRAQPPPPRPPPPFPTAPPQFEPQQNTFAAPHQPQPQPTAPPAPPPPPPSQQRF